jgi:hypothetical protein
MLKRLLFAVLLAAALVPLAGCRLFHRDCERYDDSRYSDCDRR